MNVNNGIVYDQLSQNHWYHYSSWHFKTNYELKSQGKNEFVKIAKKTLSLAEWHLTLGEKM